MDDVAGAAVELFVSARPRTLVLSGGTTPKAFYERLATVAYPWDEVEVVFGDERCVPSDSPLSNYGMARQALLARTSARAYPIDGRACDATAYERLLRERFGPAPGFDFALYGLGSDGHTASLFPDRPEIDVTDRLAVFVRDPGQGPFVPRVTMTATALSSARLGVFLVAGGAKATALGRLVRREDIPATRIRPSRLVVVSDRAAAAGLDVR